MLRRVLPTMLLLATTWLVTTGCGSNAGNEPESTNLKRDIVGSWTCNDGWNVMVSPDLVVSAQPQSGVGPSTTKATGLFVDDTHVANIWAFNINVFEVHIRGDKMTLKGTVTVDCSRQ